MKRVALAVVGTDVFGGMSSEENGPWLARSLSLQGWSVDTFQLIPETESDLLGFFQNWAGRVDCLVLSCKGTIQASKKLFSVLADFLEVPFPVDGEMEDLVRSGAEILSGPVPEAVGLRLSGRGSRILVFPGEPVSFRSLSQAEFGLKATSDEYGVVKVIGLSPRQVRERLHLVPADNGKYPLSLFFSPNVVTLIPQVPEEGSTALLASLRSIFAGDCLPPGVESLAHAVLQSAQEVGMSLAAAESCTGGLIGAELTGPAGASASFLGSAVCYSNEAKRDILGVPQSVLDTRGAVSEECALAMARGARRCYRSDLAVSVTGIAGPDGGSPQKPVGTVWFGLASQSGDRAFMRCFRDMDRDGVRSWTVAVALEALWRTLLGGEP